MPKLTDKQKQKIIADYIETNNYCETARMNGISEAAVRKIIKSIDEEELKKKFEEKKQQNTEEVLDAMKKRSNKKIQLIDKIFNAMDSKLENVDMFTNIKDLATAYGIIVDKELKLRELELQNKQSQNIKDAIADLPKLADLIRITPEEREKHKDDQY